MATRISAPYLAPSRGVEAIFIRSVFPIGILSPNCLDRGVSGVCGSALSTVCLDFRASRADPKLTMNAPLVASYGLSVLVVPSGSLLRANAEVSM
jgi:hypothetical protein